MLYKKQKHYDGLDCSGECKVLPPTFEGIPALVARLGSPDRVADAFPDRSQQELPDNIFDFLSLWKCSDKVDRELLVQDYNDFLQQQYQDKLRASLASKADEAERKASKSPQDNNYKAESIKENVE